MNYTAARLLIRELEKITSEQCDQIHRMFCLEEKSGSQIAKELGLSRQTETRTTCGPAALLGVGSER